MDDPLRHRLTRRPPERLADELIDLGNRETSVRDRLALLAAESDPKALAAALKRRIVRLGRGQEFVSYGGSVAFAQDLDHIVTTIRERLLPRDPDRAFELADAFLHSDAKVFDSVDDSSGAIGDVFRDACKLWLEAAAQCRRPRDWDTLFREAVATNEYGVRDDLLPNAAILFSEEKLHGMVAGYLAEARSHSRKGDQHNHEALSASVKASQLAIALRDPRLYEEAITAIGGRLNDLQRLQVARRYLEFGDAEGALVHLTRIADRGNLERLDLFAECYGRLGRVGEQIAALEQLFERTLSKRAHNEILKLRSAEEEEATRRWARDLAPIFPDACTAAAFLFEAGWPDDAERLVLERGGEMASTYYSRLLELITLAEAAGRRIVQVVCYRHLIRDILNDARSRVYGHAVKYYRTLEALDPLIGNYGLLGDHASFVAELRKKHSRKSGFWGRLDAHRK